jgi:hypothetical protein
MVRYEQRTRPAESPRDTSGRRHPDGWVDQVVRRQAFEAAWPTVRIQPFAAGQPWTALVPMADGSQVAVRCWELRGLLDRLDAVCRGQ